MITAIIISAFLCALGLTVTVLAILHDWEDWAFNAGIITMIASFSVMIFCAIYHDDVTKKISQRIPSIRVHF